jgi:hypothetical protein
MYVVSTCFLVVTPIAMPSTHLSWISQSPRFFMPKKYNLKPSISITVYNHSNHHSNHWKVAKVPYQSRRSASSDRATGKRCHGPTLGWKSHGLMDTCGDEGGGKGGSFGPDADPQAAFAATLTGSCDSGFSSASSALSDEISQASSWTPITPGRSVALCPSKIEWSRI